LSTNIKSLCDDWEKSIPQTLPITDEQRAAFLTTLCNTRSGYSFAGNLADLFKLQEMWALRIGNDDEWLVDLYNKSFPFKNH